MDRTLAYALSLVAVWFGGLALWHVLAPPVPTWYLALPVLGPVVLVVVLVVLESAATLLDRFSR